MTGEIKTLTTVPPLLLWLAGPCLRSWQTAPEVPPSRSLLPLYTFLEPKGVKGHQRQSVRGWRSQVEKKKWLPYTVCRLTSFFTTSSSGSEFMGSSPLEYPSFSSEASTERDALFQPVGGGGRRGHRWDLQEVEWWEVGGKCRMNLYHTHSHSTWH